MVNKKKRLICLMLALTLLSGVSALAAEPAAAAQEQAEFDPAEYAGQCIGVPDGTIFDQMAQELIPDCSVAYYTSATDIATALESGKISAYILDEPVARLVLNEYPNQYIQTALSVEDYGMIFPKDGEKTERLVRQMNEFLAEFKSQGGFEELKDIWFGEDESKKVVHYENLTGENGTLKFATNDENAPFDYVQDGQVIGYDLDMAERFCEKYGYGLDIRTMDFAGLLASVTVGKVDFGACTITITPERQESLAFSDPNYTGGAVLVTLRPEDAAQEQTEFDPADYDGKRIGVMTGAIGDTVLLETVPGAEHVYFEAAADLPVALEAGKIDAYVNEAANEQVLLHQYPDQQLITTLSVEAYAYAFPKGAEKSALLCEQMNEFLAEIEANGVMQELEDLWCSGDESKMVVDYKSLPDINGTLHMSTSSSVGVPFCFILNGEVVGYDIDLAVRFCEKYGYALEISDSNFAGVIAAVQSGKCDFAGASITITDERRESFDFSEPNYYAGTVLAGMRPDAEAPAFDPADYNDKRIGILTGSISDQIADKFFPDCQRVYCDTVTDLAIALTDGKVDAYIDEEPTQRFVEKEYPEHQTIARLTEDGYGYIFTKGTEKSRTLIAQMNEFLAEIEANGVRQEIEDIWFGDDESKMVVDYESLPDINGTVRMATTSIVGVPFSFVKDGKNVGYDIDVAARFCEKYGYALEVTDSNFAGVLSNVQSGKCDFAGSSITVTDERRESFDFSDPNYMGGMVFVTLKGSDASGASGKEGSAFFSGIAESFEKTFIREQRWKLFVAGIGVTVLITVLSAVFGAALGFGVYMIYRKENKIFNGFINVLMDILEKTPVVVILMILYYIIFGKSSLDGIWVSVIGFTLLFMDSVIGLIKMGVGAVDKGQTEASLALGYTDSRGFMRVILPQAAFHFMPGLRSELVSLIKGTAVVGYIAVQDLTKVGDVIRSRTYEAFFPLIASAVIYFAIAWLLTFLLKRVEFHIDPTKRKKDRILKGVQTK